MYFSFGLTLSLVCPALRVYHRSLGHLCRCWTDPCLCRVLLVQLLNSESDVGPLNWNVLVMELTSQGNCKNTRRETRVNHSSSSSLLGAASAASRAFRALDISLAPSFSAPSRLPRADRFQSLIDDDEGERRVATHGQGRISTLLSSFQEAGVSSPGHASNPNLRVWARYSTGPVQRQPQHMAMGGGGWRKRADMSWLMLRFER